MKDIFKKESKKLVSISELIKILQKHEDPDNVFVGTVGHFGNFLSVDRDEFDYIREAYITPDGNWRNETRKKLKVLDVSFPDIGPDPN